MYRNNEGYSDPTAGAAMSRLMKEYKQNQRKRYEIKNRPNHFMFSETQVNKDEFRKKLIRTSMSW